MIKHTETNTMEDKLWEADKHRRLQQRGPNGLSGLMVETPPVNHHEPANASRMVCPAAEPGRSPLRSPMRVLLRHYKTMKFLGDGERWTKDPKRAKDFRCGWWATVHAFTLNPRHLVIEYEFDDERYNLHIPVLGHHHIRAAISAQNAP